MKKREQKKERDRLQLISTYESDIAATNIPINLLNSTKLLISVIDFQLVCQRLKLARRMETRLG